MQSMTVRELKARLDASGGKPLILDVRENWETRLCALPNSTFISMGQIPARIADLDAEREIVVVCHHGVRSLQVAYYLANQGFKKLYNLQGGVDAWAREIDPAMHKY